MQKNKLLYKTWVEIEQSSFLHNLTELQKRAGKGVVVMAVLKANAYGHGLCEVGSMIQRRRDIMVGVDSLPEALALKTKRLTTPIMIFGYIPTTDIPLAIRNRFHISIYTKELLREMPQILRRMHSSITPCLHMKIETGTNRLGIKVDELKRASALSWEGIYTHFAETENPRSRFYREQLSYLQRALTVLAGRGCYPHFVHSASTAGLLQYPETHGNVVRAGIGLYGLWPSAAVKHRMFDKIALRPVLSWKTRIAQVKEILPGTSVGYDRTWRARHPTRIAILPVGYYDGYDRGLSNNGSVLIGGQRASVVGRVCMNMTMVQLQSTLAKAGDEVVLIGKQRKEEISADEVADRIRSINYEVVSRINPLLPRIIV